MSVRARLLLLLMAVLVISSVLLTERGQRYLALLGDPGTLHLWLTSWGMRAPLALIALQVIQVVLAPIPGQVLGLASGHLFGVGWGTFYSTVGTALGSLIAIKLARALGRPLVERLLAPDLLSRFDAGAQRHGLLFFFLVFLLPFVPDDAACLAAGLTQIPIPALMLAVLAGRPPGILVSCWLGANAAGLSPTQLVAVICLSALLAVPFLYYGNRLPASVLAIAQRLARLCRRR